MISHNFHLTLGRDTHLSNPGPLSPEQLAPGQSPSSGLRGLLSRAVAVSASEDRGGGGREGCF